MTHDRPRDEAALLREDETARAEALDVTRSFLVQAPAGSGKTELLIQRYLALMARVDEPERVLALTFTRKAAGEMRERVLEALADAALQRPLEECKPHQRITRRLASAVLAQDRERGWALTEHPARLRILTFDALATWIVRSAPFSARLGPAPGYVDDPRGLYAEAAAAAIAGAPAADPHWQRLLVHLHNDAEQAASLLARLLARRDQVLRQIGIGDRDGVRRALETALTDEVDDAVGALARAFPADLAPEIARLARYAAQTLGDCTLAYGLHACVQGGGVPGGDAACLPLWRTLADWLLTKEGGPRGRITAQQGFGPGGREPGKAERAQAKQDMEALVARVAAVPGLAAMLAGVASMPEPEALGADAWEVVDALLAVFPQVVARLTLAFAASGEVDFPQASIAALAALGEADAPSDLLERLDARLAHLLVDEFQDTSATQLELLRRLTAGWTPGEDGRTIFAVGDPMQSIYRFREAEVRLFVEAQLSGSVAGVPVACLTLRRNFRSQQGLVAWVNRVFPAVLGRVDDPARGAVAFEEATAVQSALAGIAVTLDVVPDVEAEARAVVRHVTHALAHEPDAARIAILVRARQHLAAILPALRAARVPFTAVELDKLGARQAVQDLLALTHALLQPADRLAWLAVLRAPWCGLALADLAVLADAAPPPQPLWTALAADALPPALSDAGRRSLARVRPLLDAALAAHGHCGVVERVRGAWLALGGPACLADPLDLDTAERFFALLAAHERGGDVPDWGRFCTELDELRASSEPEPGSRVQVMTMHKAKGLEFDVVILPGLARRGRGATHELMRWRTRGRGLLIAPSKSPGGEVDRVYAYLAKLEKDESAAELGRLLYVACTRARSRLCLVAACPVKEDDAGGVAWRPPSSSSLAPLWSSIAMDAPPASPAPPEAQREPQPLPLLRLPATYVPTTVDDGLAPRPVAAEAPRDDLPFDWAQERARVIGTLAHRMLARVAEGAADKATWDDARVASLLPRVRADLVGAGFAGAEVDAAAQRVLDVVRRTLADARGRWLFDPRHDDARSEWALAGIDGGAIVHLVLDRTFVAEGERWIVDFKTGVHEGGDTAGFLDREAQRYAPQLQRYGRLMGALDARPVRLALYHPMVAGGFREIPAS